jgi:hypothetical protein
MINEGLSNEQLAQLVGSGECYIHVHPKEILGFAERLELMEAAPVIEISGDHTAGPRDEILLVDTSAGNVTITLPLAQKGREYQIVKTTPGFTLFIVPTTPDTLIGSTMGVSIVSAFSSLHWKSISGGYILI